MIKCRNLIKKKPKWFKNKKTEFDTTNARASEVSGPTRIRFCAKYQKNQHYGPEDPKKPVFDRDPIHQPLALRARSFQVLKLALRARFRAQTTSPRSACGLTLGRESAKKMPLFQHFFCLKSLDL